MQTLKCGTMLGRNTLAMKWLASDVDPELDVYFPGAKTFWMSLGQAVQNGVVADMNKAFQAWQRWSCIGSLATGSRFS